MKGKKGKSAMRGGGMARKGVGAALKGGGLARKGVGQALASGGMAQGAGSSRTSSPVSRGGDYGKSKLAAGRPSMGMTRPGFASPVVRRANGGPVKMTAGAGSGSGRLEKVANHKSAKRVPAQNLKHGGKAKGK